MTGVVVGQATGMCDALSQFSRARGAAPTSGVPYATAAASSVQVKPSLDLSHRLGYRLGDSMDRACESHDSAGSESESGRS